MFEWVGSKGGLSGEERIEIMRPLFRQLIEGMVVSKHWTFVS